MQNFVYMKHGLMRLTVITVTTCVITETRTPGEGMMDIPYLFKLLAGVREMPAIILDELKLEKYQAALVRLETLCY